MNTNRFALFGGTVMLAMGVLSLIPALSVWAEWLPRLRVEVSYGLFLGLFPMNILNKLTLILFGLAGVAAARTSYGSSVTFAKTVAVTMGIAAVFGMIPGFNTLFGYWPLMRGEILAHGVFAILGWYFGFLAPTTKRSSHV